MSQLEKLLNNGFFWGIVGLVAIAAALSGKLNSDASVVLLWIAYVLCIFGTYRGFVTLRWGWGELPATAVVAILLIYPTVLTVRWVSSKEPERITATLVWGKPDPIKDGAALSAKQLNARAVDKGKEVPGDYLYNPTFGTTMRGGVITLSVTFTPSDITHYFQVSKTITLAVETAQPLPKPKPSITPSRPSAPPDPALALLGEAQALSRALAAYQVVMFSGWQKLQERLENDRRLGYANREADFAEHKALMDTTYVQEEVRAYQQQYSQDAVRIRKQLLEQVPEHGLRPYLDYANPGNGGGVGVIKEDLDSLIREYQAKIAHRN